jgi:hypothetical protein
MFGGKRVILMITLSLAANNERGVSQLLNTTYNTKKRTLMQQTKQ